MDSDVYTTIPQSNILSLRLHKNPTIENQLNACTTQKIKGFSNPEWFDRFGSGESDAFDVFLALVFSGFWLWSGFVGDWVRNCYLLKRRAVE